MSAHSIHGLGNRQADFYRPTDFSKLAQLGGQGVLVLFSDSTNAEKPGHTMSEKDIEDSLFKLVENARGRIIMATFASLISRIQQILNVSKKLNRKVAFSGRSMIANVEVAASLKALNLPPETAWPIDNNPAASRRF